MSVPFTPVRHLPVWWTFTLSLLTYTHTHTPTRPSFRNGRCFQSSMQSLSPLHQYAMFLFGGHLPSLCSHSLSLSHTHTHTSPTRPSFRKSRCVQSSMQCLSPLHQYAIFLFGGHLPSPYTVSLSLSPHTNTHTHTSPTRPSFRNGRCVQSSMQCLSPLHLSLIHI